MKCKWKDPPSVFRKISSVVPKFQVKALIWILHIVLPPMRRAPNVDRWLSHNICRAITIRVPIMFVHTYLIKTFSEERYCGWCAYEEILLEKFKYDEMWILSKENTAYIIFNTFQKRCKTTVLWRWNNIMIWLWIR